MVKHEADALTLYKRWSLRPDVTVDDVRRFVVERILPAYERLSPDVELGLEAEADGRSVIAVVLKSNTPHIWTDSEKLLRWALERP